MDATGCERYIAKYKYLGFNNKEIIYGNIVEEGINIQRITKSEYLSITRPKEETPPQRDWTGVRFKTIYTGNLIFTVKSKENKNYIISWVNDNKFNSTDYRIDTVNQYFEQGVWTEVPKEEQPTILDKNKGINDYIDIALENVVIPNEENQIIDATIDGLVHGVSKQRREAIQQAVDVVTIQAEKPRDPLNLFDMEKRLKATEDTIDVLSRDKENLWVAVKALEAAIFGSKQNLDIEDWKTVECLSYEELIEFFESCSDGYFGSEFDCDIEALENHTKKKLNK